MPVPAMPALTDTLLTWALWYAELDWPIFPAHTPTAQGCSCLHTATCTSPGKHPRLTGWQKRATTDPAMIQKWWGEMWPTANVALATGHTCWVLDVDCAAAVRGDLTLEALTHTHGPLPETPLVHSGGGGFHHFFQLPTTGIIGNAVKFLPGLDTRGEGGLIVLPPSQHASGRPYMWDSEHDLETTPLAPAPDWLLAMIQSPQDSAQVHGVPDAPILEPGRNNTLSRMAFHMRTSGMAIAEIVIALSAVNERCVPRLDDVEILKIAEGKTAIPADPYFIFTPNGTMPGSNGTQAATATPPAWTDSTPWEEMYGKHYPVRQWHIQKVIPHGLSIMGGAPKSRKTTIAYDICLSSVGQGLALNYWGCMPGPVLYCSCEDEQGDSKRLIQQLRPQMPATTPHALRFVNTDEVPTFTGGLLEYVREQVERYQFALVVIDPLMYVLDQPIPRGVDPFVAMKKMLLPFQWLASELAFALLFVDHTRKASVQDVDAFSTLYGTQAKQALAMTLMMVARDGDELTIKTKGRGAGDHTFLFTCTQDARTEHITWTFGGADQGMLSGSRQKVVLQAFANARDAGKVELSPRDVIDYAELEQSATAYNNIRQALFKLRRKRVLLQMKSGLFVVADPSILPQPTPPDDDPGVTIP